MDIVTHATAGVALAAPFVLDHPIPAACFVAGSVFPDLDAFSRVGGKMAFLKWHQSITHSIVGIAVAIGVCAGLLLIFGEFLVLAPVALGAGMLLHSLLDLSNTFGITILYPFNRKRISLEWVFFVDAVWCVVGLAGCAVGLWSILNERIELTIWSGSLTAGILVLYDVVKWQLRRYGLKLSPPGTISLIPSALLPWQFFGCIDDGKHAAVFKLNLFDRKPEVEEIPIFDHEYADILEQLAEYRLMRELVPTYHVTQVEEEGGQRSEDGGQSTGSFVKLTCRDLRTRNFGGKFGTLELTIGNGEIGGVVFHV